MKIDATRFAMFWANPERYRLRECWKLAPIEPQPGTFASLLTYGRRRGSCLHELLDARYKKVTIDLEAEGFGELEIKAAKRMSAIVPVEDTLAHEALFDTPLPNNSRHSATGRIDSIIRRDGEVLIHDYKSSKHRSKTDIQKKLEQYCNSVQVPFYYIGAKALGFEPTGFVYSLVVDGKNGPAVYERRTHRTAREIREFERAIHITCSLIEHLKAEYGVEQPWPIVPEQFNTGYESIQGRAIYPDFIPDGFTTKKEHLPTMETVDAN